MKKIYITLILSSILFSSNLLSQQNIPEISTQTEVSKANEEYIKTFKYGTPSQKLNTISQIKKTKNEGDIILLVEHYPNEENNKVKSEILTLFKQVKNDRAKDIIEYAIEDENDSVRKEAYYLCSIYPDIKFESNIMSKISNENGLVLDSMISALTAMKSQNASDFLLEKYTNNSVGTTTKIEILKYFSENKDPRGETISRNAALNSGEAITIRYTAIVALGSYPSAENYEVLKKLLDENLPEITARVIYILPKYSAFSNVKKDIIEAAKNDNESVRIYAIKALDDYKNDTEVEELLLYRLKNDNSESIMMEILNLYTDSTPSANMLEAIKKLAETSYNKKIKDKASAIASLDKSNENS